MSEADMKAYVVRLSLPVEAPSMGEAIATFFDMARASGWVFRVSTPAGDFMVNTDIDPESGSHRVMDVLPAP